MLYIIGCNGTWHNITNAPCTEDLQTCSSEMKHMWVTIPNTERMGWLISIYPAPCFVSSWSFPHFGWLKLNPLSYQTKVMCSLIWIWHNYYDNSPTRTGPSRLSDSGSPY